MKYIIVFVILLFGCKKTPLKQDFRFCKGKYLIDVNQYTKLPNQNYWSLLEFTDTLVIADSISVKSGIYRPEIKGIEIVYGDTLTLKNSYYKFHIETEANFIDSMAYDSGNTKVLIIKVLEKKAI